MAISNELVYSSFRRLQFISLDGTQRLIAQFLLLLLLQMT
jgi:hypothetical protein